ncbi:dihydrofolate reductase family protein, partial [Mycolicibacterium vaccae]
QRRELGLGDDPPPIAVVSRSGRLPETLFDSPVRPILVTSATGRTDEPRCDVIVSGDDTVDIAHAIGELKRRGMHRILCEGGPTLLDELVTADLVDELCVTLAPRLAGHQPVGRSAPAGLTEPTDMTLERLLVDPGGFLYLRYARS